MTGPRLLPNVNRRDLTEQLPVRSLQSYSSWRTGPSLLLSNVPMSPKFINGSFAALFDNVDIVADYARHISRSRADDLNGCPIRLSPRRRLDDRPRQYSLDHSFPLQPASMAATRQRAIFRPEVRQGSLDSKIEEIFQTPVEEDDECDEEGGEQKEKKAEEARGKVDAMTVKENPTKIKDGSQAKDAPVNGIVVVGGRKTCMHCGNLLED